jgi:hypothetical protein
MVESYSNMVCPKEIGKTDQTPEDQGSGSSPANPTDNGLEEEKNKKTQETRDIREINIESNSKRCDISDQKYPALPQDGSSGSSGSIGDPNTDSSLVSSGSAAGSNVCDGCDQPADQLIDKPGGSFCPACMEKFDAQDAARKETP